MAGYTETGHAVNVANFERIVADVATYGGKYNPSNPGIKLKAITNQLKASQDILHAVNAAESSFKLATAARAAAFEPLSRLLTRVLNALRASGASKRICATALSHIRKIQGHRATPKKSGEQNSPASKDDRETVEISSSRMSFDNRMENFDKLVKLLSTVKSYNPNEADLQISSLIQLYETFNGTNTVVTAATVKLSNARIARDKILYQPGSGMRDNALGIKAYVKSIFGARSEQYHKISRIKFTKPR